MMTLREQRQEAFEANEWFKLQDIQSFIDDDISVYIVVGDGFEIQISSAEISYRAELFRNYKN
jgi:uncharacterized protein YrrD